jgi:hypothetical protein
MTKKSGTIRKWSNSWGIANSYCENSDFPQKYFVHLSKRVSPDIELGLGVKIVFVPGSPRKPGDLPAALEIELAPVVVAR